MKTLALLIPVVVLALLAPVLGEYQIYLLSLTLLWGLLALGMGLVLGYAGEAQTSHTARRRHY